MASTTSGSDDSSSTVEVVYNITIRARIQNKIKILINLKKKDVSELQRESISKFHDQVTGPEYNTDLVSRSAPAKRPRITSIKPVHKSINTSYCVTCHHSF